MDKSQWKISDRFIAMLAIPFGIAFLAMLILPMLAGSHKLIGNRQAIFQCRNYLLEASRAKTNSPNFDFSNLPSDDKHYYGITLAPYFDFLAKTNFVWGNSTNREIVIVSQKQFGNVHKLGFWNSFWPNPAYAVGYSDGTAGIISPKDFTNLNLNGFVSLSSLATNSDFRISKP